MKTKTRFISPPLADHNTLRTHLEPGEIIVLDYFISHLPLEWEIYVQPHLNGLRPDFVLLNPRIGIAVFEVKNWDLLAMNYWVDMSQDPPKLMANNGKRDFSLAASDPVSKIRYYKEMIEELFCPRMNSTAKHALITAGIIFSSATTQQAENLLLPLLRRYKLRPNPNSEQAEDTVFKATPYYPLSGIDALRSGNMNVVFPESLRRTSGKMCLEYAEDLRNWLVEPSISSEQRKPLPMDTRQRQLATTRAPQGYRRIRGPAGSGKSLVLAARAGQLVAEGKNILVVTYNITLLHYLQDLAVRWSELSRKCRKEATWWNFHLWCKHVCFEAGAIEEYKQLWKSFKITTKELSKKEQDSRLSDFLTNTLPVFVGHTIDRADNQITKYDAVLVDEGQDFDPQWWNLLRRVCREKGEMLLAADATQDIYTTAARWTDETMFGAGFRGDWSELRISYRLPNTYLPYVSDYAAKYLPKELRNLPTPKSELPNMYPCSQRWVQITEGNPVQICCKEILRLLKRHADGELSVADVVLLTQQMGAGLAVVEQLSDKYKYGFAHTYSPDDEECRRLKHAFFLGDARLKATTIHSFKGYETRALVLLIDKNSYQPMRELLYVGLTRLREDPAGSYITVICTDNSLSEYGNTWPEYEEMKGENTGGKQIIISDRTLLQSAAKTEYYNRKCNS